MRSMTQMNLISYAHFRIKRYSQDLLGEDPSNVYLTSVMPCVKKRGESDHVAFTHEGVRDVDNVITTKDLGNLLNLHSINPDDLEPIPYDSPFQVEENCPDGLGTGAGQLFGATGEYAHESMNYQFSFHSTKASFTAQYQHPFWFLKGGVMEAAVRSVYEILTESQLPKLELEEVRGLEGIKEANITLMDEKTGKGLDMELRVAVANGLGNAKKLIAAMKEGTVTYDMVEVMACPGGCIGGGGQPQSKDKEVLNKRQQVIYSLEKSLPIRRSHENPTIKAFYERYLKEMGGATAHELLHVKPVYGENMNEESD